MSAKDKKQAPIRLYPEKYQKIKERLEEDGLSFQKLAETLFDAYLANNKEILRLVGKRIEDRGNKNHLDSTEREELMRIIEKEHSPLRDLLEKIREIEDEEESDIHY